MLRPGGELHGHRRFFGQVQVEGMGVPPDLVHEALLHVVGRGGHQTRVNLLADQLHLLAEAEAHHLVLLSTEAVRHGHLAEEERSFSFVFEVLSFRFSFKFE